MEDHNNRQGDVLTLEENEQIEDNVQAVIDRANQAAPDNQGVPVETGTDPELETVSEAAVEQPAAEPMAEARAAEPVNERPAAEQRAQEPVARPAPAATANDDESIAPAFEDLGLSGNLLRSLKEVGYEEPTPIQVRTIPLLLAGRDTIAQAQTGSGKTAAFGLPIIETIDTKIRAVQALILCPTRELAIQVSEALHKYGKHKEVETLPIYGGQPYERQFRGLQRGVQIVVGTPGRVMDHMRRGTLMLDHLRFFVLDEADEMLDMGFIDDIEWILEQAPKERQTALFSATMPPRIASLAQRHMNNPERVTVAGKEMTVPSIQQISFEVPRARKVDALTRILDAETPTLTMIFCRTKNGVDELGESLVARGYAVETLHGDLSQAQRDRVMRRFRGGQADILIATDVAARGLDIPDVSHVVNYDIPDSAEAYVHRIGRTARAGKTGIAITLIAPREVRWLRQIERVTRARVELRRLPTLADVAERRREAIKQQILAVVEQEDSLAQYLDVVNDLADEHEMSEIAAAVLKLYADESGRAMTPEQQEDDIATFSAATGGGRSPRGETGMVRLQLSIGRIQGVRPQDIVGAIANEAGIPGRAIGAIDILDAYTFVDIPQEFVDQVLSAMRSIRMKGHPVNAEVARPGGAPESNRGGGGNWDRGPRDGGGGYRGGGGGGGYRGGSPRNDFGSNGGGGYGGGGGSRPRPSGPPRRNSSGGGVRPEPVGGGSRRYDRRPPTNSRPPRRED